MLENHGRAALAPRLAAGYAWGEDRSVWGLEAGVIGSYRVQTWFEPYAALRFANHWFSSRNTDPDKHLAPNQHFAARKGYGDGLFKVAAGVDFRFATGWHALAEYSHWFRAQNDPGDGYSLLANDVLAIALAYQGE